MGSDEGTQLWEDLVEEFTREDPAIERSTMMGFPCLRIGGNFFGSLEHRTGQLIVKLPKERVAALIASGDGEAFSPAGRTFKEWVVVPGPDRQRWRERLDEARKFVAG